MDRGAWHRQAAITKSWTRLNAHLCSHVCICMCVVCVCNNTMPDHRPWDFREKKDFWG